MNDRLWTMKVVVEKDRKFICVIIRKILCLENFPFPFHNQQAAVRSVSVLNIFVAVEYNIRRSLMQLRVILAKLKLVRGFKSI